MKTEIHNSAESAHVAEIVGDMSVAMLTMSDRSGALGAHEQLTTLCTAPAAQ